MAFRMRDSGFFRAGVQRMSMQASESYRQQPRRGVYQQLVSIRIARAGVGAAAGVATAAAIVFAAEEGRLDGTPRALSNMRGMICRPLGLLRVVHADAAPPLKVDEDGLPELAEGEKPELIKQADAEAEKAEQLQRPAQFADQFHEVRNLTSVNSFEGFRLDVTKVVTPTFFASHAAFFGSPQFPGGYYHGALMVLGDGDKMIRASMDHDGNVSSEAHIPLGPGLQGKINLQAGKQDMLMGTAVYQGETFSSQGFVGVGPVFGVSYNQALTPRLSVGGEGSFSAPSQSATLQYGFKYNTPSWGFTGLLVGGNVLVAQYVRRVVPGRVTLGAEYQGRLWSPEESQTCVGAEFSLRQSKVSASLDSNGKVDSAVEVKLNTFLPMMPVTLSLSSSLDHGENKANFGLGVTLGQ